MDPPQPEQKSLNCHICQKIIDSYTSNAYVPNTYVTQPYNPKRDVPITYVHLGSVRSVYSVNCINHSKLLDDLPCDKLPEHCPDESLYLDVTKRGVKFYLSLSPKKNLGSFGI
jgi:hypothetical protein